MKTTHRGESRQRGTSENSQTRYISRRHPKEQPDKPEITPIKGQGRAMTEETTQNLKQSQCHRWEWLQWLQQSLINMQRLRWEQTEMHVTRITGKDMNNTDTKYNSHDCISKNKQTKINLKRWLIRGSCENNYKASNENNYR